jgi:hypothetical protein
MLALVGLLSLKLPLSYILKGKNLDNVKVMVVDARKLLSSLIRD